MKNWKTTVGGGIPAVSIIVNGVATHDWPQVLFGVGLLLVSFFAKDFDVTGGPQEQ